MAESGYTVSFGKIEKGVLFAIKKQARAYLRNRHRGEELAPPRIWEDERRITFPGWPKDVVTKALDYSYDRMGPKFRRLDPEIREATLADLGQREAADEEPEEEQPAAPTIVPAVPRDATWTQHLIDKTRDEVSQAYEDQLRRERAKTASLQERVESLLTDRQRLQKEKEEAEKARRSVEQQNDNLIKSMMSFADDPSKAALQVVGRAASWVRRLETQAAEGGAKVDSRPIDDLIAIAKKDLVAYANELLAPSGTQVGSIDELKGLADPTVWEDTEYHKARSSDYLRAKEELEFVEGVEAGTLKVPESIRDLISKGLEKAPRVAIVRDFESRRREHLDRRNAGSVATQAERTHAYANRMMDLMANRSEKDPVPVAVIYRSEAGDSGQIEVRIPTGLQDGPISKFLEDAVRDAAQKAGFIIELDPGSAEEHVIRLGAASPDQTRADLLRRQGAFRETLTNALEESGLHGAGVTFRVLDIRDFEI